MKTKILIEVQDGFIQSVSSNKDIDIVIIDRDLNDQSKIVGEVLAPDTITENMYELYTNESYPMDMEIRDKLKTIKY